jgi:hypothetical protein
MAYQQKHNALPRSLGQLRTTGQSLPFTEDVVIVDEGKGVILDGWHRPFLCSSDGTNFLVTSYGRDGKPGGAGLDCDLTNKNRYPRESLPTFLQFVFDMEMGGIVGTCVVCGVLTFLLSLFTIKSTDLTRQGIVVLGAKIGATVIGAVIVAVIISALHIPSGH